MLRIYKTVSKLKTMKTTQMARGLDQIIRNNNLYNSSGKFKLKRLMTPNISENVELSELACLVRV